MEAREYLGHIAKNECLIANKLAERQYWLEMATGITAGVGGERVQSSGSLQSMERNVIEAQMIDAEIDRLKAEIDNIIKTMEQLNKEQYDFLHKRYVQKMSMKEISSTTKKSYSQLKNTKKAALKNLQRILEKER